MRQLSKQIYFLFFIISFFFVDQKIISAQQVHAQSVSPVFSTDFENTTKLDNNHLNLSITNWFEFGDYDGGNTGDGARMWIDATKGHSGTKSIGLEVSDITKSRRAEFNIYPYAVAGDEITVSSWLYLPANYGLHAPGIDWNWHEFYVLSSEYVPGYDKYLRLLIEQPDITKSIFNLTLGGRQPPSVQYESARVNNFALPRGRWFNVRSYVKRDTINGIAKVWIDDQLIFDKNGLSIKGTQTDYQIAVGKVYYEPTDTTLHQLWVDDVTIYRGYVPPNPVLTSTPTSSIKPGDANGDRLVDGIDYVAWLNHYGQTVSGAINGNFNTDSVVDGLDYVIWLNNYGR